MNGKLNNLSHELDFGITAIGARLETLVDVENLLGNLREDMDTAVLKGEEQAYYREHHRMVRVISELFRYTIKDLNKEYEKTNKIELEIFDAVVKNIENKKA